MKVRASAPVEKLFPNAAGRAAADEAIDALPTTLSMQDYLDAWEQAYFDKTKKSPLRRPR